MNKEILIKLIEKGYSQRKIAITFNVVQSTIRYWLKKYNLKTKTIKSIIQILCICERCDREYEYNQEFKKKGYTHTHCNSCYTTIKRIKYKKILVEYKGGKCVECNYNRCFRNLEFHHLDPTKKSFNISHTLFRKIDELKKEADKCILLCSNCHGEVEEGIREISAYIPSV